MTADDLDREVRLSVYRHFVRTGLAPSLRETSGDVGADPTTVSASLERLDANRVLVLHPTTRQRWMAMPFSAIPIEFRVTSGERAWWANCAWDVLGISAMLRIPAEITPSCTDCGDPLTVRTTGCALSDPSGVIHFAVRRQRGGTILASHDPPYCSSGRRMTSSAGALPEPGR